MRKILVAILSVLCLSCTAFAVACKDKPKYYTLTYDTTGGVTYTFEGNNENILSGAQIKENYTVVFSIDINSSYDGVPAVYVNDTEIQPNADGKYSFTMTSDTTVKVTGLWRTSSYEVIFDEGETAMELGFIEYLDPTTGNELDYTIVTDNAGNELKTLTVSAGDEVSFKLHKSVYYADTYSVLADTEELTADANGVYTFTPSGNTTISVQDLEMDTPFCDLEGYGSGTATDPYIISRPVDLYAMSSLIGNSFYNGYYALSYYVLANDIDMQGERLYVIGDDPDSGYFFGGNFNGNGHTISNYYMIDTKVDQDDYTTQYLTYVGFFGCAAATTYGSAEIYNLTLDNFEININAERYDSMFMAGGLVGWGSGVNITGCTVNGTINAYADSEYFGFAGGVIGYLQSTVSSSDSSTRYYATVTSCASNVDITVFSGYVYAAGGVVGYLASYQDIVSASVINSYFAGEVSGSINAGGIVGMISDNGFIKNCYSTGTVNAYTTIAYNTSYPQYANASAGGIVGYAGANVVVADSVSQAVLTASATSGSTYQHTDSILAYALDASTQSVSGFNAYTVNCYGDSDVKLTTSFFKNTLGWSEGDWVFTDGSFPVINFEATSHTFAITLNYGEYKVGGNSTTTINVSDTYIPISYWYVLSNGFSQYYDADNGYRSYGLYFDSQFTKKVPVGYIPTSDITLYVAFANYADVAGEYAFVTSSGKEVTLTLGLNGVATYRDGAMSYLTDYAYNGKYAIIYETCLALASDNISEVSYYDDYKAVLSDGVLSIDCILRSVESSTVTYTTIETLKAVQKDGTFTYGTYNGTNGTKYVFNKNGTGTVGTSSITYTIKDDQITIKNSSTTLTGTIDRSAKTITISGVVYTALDVFAGTWEKSATTHKRYTFDGVGGWSFEYYGYTNGKKTTISSASGTYEINADGNRLTLKNTDSSAYGTAIYDVDTGFIAVTVDGVAQTYYSAYSFAGEWSFNTRINAVSEYVELTLGGITKDGVGKATLTFQNAGEYDLEYTGSVENGVETIVLYYYDTLFGKLTFNTTDYTLEGSIYSMTAGDVINTATFFVKDDFTGEWISDNSVLSIVEFNGYGSYDMSATANHFAVNGTVTIGGKSAGSYKLVNGTMEGSFVYEGVTYTISYNETTGKIDVTYDGGSAELQGYDEWKNIVLVDGDGATYSFDGRGALTTGGTMTVVSADNTKATYTYFATSNGVSADSGSIVITKDTANNSYVYGQNTLLIKNSFTGNWYLSSEYGATMTIGTIGANLTASGKFLGNDVTYVYSPEGAYLSFEYSGTTLYINVLKSELTISTDNSALNVYATAISKLDAFYGTYSASDGTSIRFDGFGESSTGIGVIEILGKTGIVSSTYYYTIDSNGDPVVTINSNSYLFTTKGASKADVTYSINGTNYCLGLLDRMYTREASDPSNVRYVFDGLGGLTTYVYRQVNGAFTYVADQTYTYTVDAVVTSSKHIVLTITNTTTNKSERIVYDYSSPAHVYHIDDLYDVSASGAGLTYTFDGMGSGTRSDDETFTYTLVSVDVENDTYYITITESDGTTKNATIVGGEDSESNIIKFD